MKGNDATHAQSIIDNSGYMKISNARVVHPLWIFEILNSNWIFCDLVNKTAVLKLEYECMVACSL